MFDETNMAEEEAWLQQKRVTKAVAGKILE